jgi:hypothetical protein
MSLSVSVVMIELSNTTEYQVCTVQCLVVFGELNTLALALALALWIWMVSHLGGFLIPLFSFRRTNT